MHLKQYFVRFRVLVEGRLITVFGCGGERDKGKRAEMGELAVFILQVLLSHQIIQEMKTHYQS